MSADNRICYMKWGGGEQWYAWHGSGSMYYYEPPSYAQAFMSKDEMRQWVEKEEADTYILEYGVGEIGLEEQQLALQEEINDCQRRLGNLIATGYQYPQWKEFENS